MDLFEQLKFVPYHIKLDNYLGKYQQPLHNTYKLYPYNFLFVDLSGQ